MKRYKAKRKMCSFTIKKDESNTGNDTNLDQAKNKYSSKL